MPDGIEKKDKEWGAGKKCHRTIRMGEKLHEISQELPVEKTDSNYKPD